MYIVDKIFFRKPSYTILTIFLLVISILTVSTAYVSFSAAKKQLKNIDMHYTTIGIHAGLNADKLWGNGLQRQHGEDSILFEDGSLYIGPTDACNIAKQSDFYIGNDAGFMLSACVAGATALTSGTMNILDYNCVHDSRCYQLSVLAIECNSIVELDEEGWESYEISGTIIDTVCQMDAYDLPPENDTIQIRSSLYTTDEKIPFVVGKKYLVRGFFWDYPIDDLGFESFVGDDGKEQLNMKRGRSIHSGDRFLFMEGDSSLVDNMATLGRASGTPNYIYDIYLSEETGKYYFVTPEYDCWPYFAEYTGSWQDFLISEDGSVWREEIIPNFGVNHASAPVILTNNIGSLYLFNSGDASILEGRSFNDTEYKNGDAVCLISAAYSKLNGLRLGDTITLDYYDTGFIQRECVIAGLNSKNSLTIERLPLTSENHMGIRKDYKIIGIYTSPEWTTGVQNFHADTIFVPKESIPYNGSCKNTSLPFLNTITIQNGTIDSFETHMAENGMAGSYLYFDQGYTEAAASVHTIIDNAKRIMIVGISMFILASLLFLLLFIRKTAPSIRTMRLLGVSAKKTWMECFTSLIGQVAIAALIGNALAVVLYDRITQMVLSVSLELSYGSVALCGAVQFLLLFVAGIIWTRSVANRNLMQKR